MKPITLSMMLILLVATAFSQDCRLVSAQLSIPYLKKSGGGAPKAIRTIPVKVEYWNAAGVPAAAAALTFTLAPHSAAAYNPVLLSPSFNIAAADFTTKPKEIEISLSVQIDDIAAFANGDFTIAMAMGGTPKPGIITLSLSEAAPAVADNTDYDGKPFWIELGTNLDLVDGPKLNNLTAGIFYHKFDHRWGKNGSSKWASFAGAYEAKIVSSESDRNFGTNTFVSNRSFIPGRADTIKAFIYAGKTKQTQTVRNWSFFYSPAFRLGRGKYDDGNFHIYTSVWIELRYQEVQTASDYSSLLLIDSNRVAMSAIGSYRQQDDTVVKNGVYTHYLGAGFPIYTEKSGKKGFSFLLNPVFGFTNQLTIEKYAMLPVDKAKEAANSKWNPFYFVQFRLSDNEYGITVTGEIRGLLVKDNPPQYTIALTKKFNLKKLLVYNGNE